MSGHPRRGHPRRWFIYISSGMLIFLFLAIILVAFLLLRQGRIPRTGMITGSSMEPILRGPRFAWTCSHCDRLQEFALDTCKSGQPFRCQLCNHLEMQSQIDFSDSAVVADRINPGEQVLFSNLRSIRATRRAEIATQLAQPSGLRRGDILVFQEQQDAIREVKRVVAFADEHVAIIDGDIYVNAKRWCKSLEQSLRQSILVHSWERSSLLQATNPSRKANAFWRTDKGEFSGAIGGSINVSGVIDNSNSNSIFFSNDSKSPMDNRLAVNAHDSHAIVPVSDFGIAFQPSNIEAAWGIECEFNTPFIKASMSMQFDGRSVRIRVGEQSINAELIQRQDRSVWIVIGMIDGHLIGGSQDEEWFRLELPDPSSDKSSASAKANSSPPITISAASGRLELDQLLVFHDIHYRGQNDSVSQSWPSHDRLVVLGDNVSSSSDSRDRWPEGLPSYSAKGVVLPTENPMEVLLRQR